MCQILSGQNNHLNISLCFYCLTLQIHQLYVILENLLEVKYNNI